MIKIDIHLHTSRYSACSRLDPEHIISLGDLWGIDGIVITEHDYMWSKDELSKLQEKVPSLKLYRGLEVSCIEGHFLTIGLENADKLYFDISLKELINIAEKESAAVIWAHPGRFFQLPEEPLEDYWYKLAAVEGMSTNIRNSFKHRVARMKKLLGKEYVCGSDSHTAKTPGFYATIFPSLPKDEKELAEMVIDGNTKCLANILRIEEHNSLIGGDKLLLSPPQ